MDVSIDRVDIPAADGIADAILATPGGDGSHPAVLVFMDAFGLRPRLEEMAGRLAADGFVVLVPNLFYRNGRAPVVDLGDLGDPTNRSTLFGRLRPLMAALTPEAAMRDVDAYLGFLSAHPRVSTGPVGTVGYCMGGGLALRAAAHAPGQVAATASFHGGRLATDQPNSPHLLVGQIDGEVYVGHADNDSSMPPEQQERLSAALTEARVRHSTELYAGAAHGFTMADTAVYDEAATERHWQRLLDLMGRNLHS